MTNLVISQLTISTSDMEVADKCKEQCNNNETHGGYKEPVVISRLRFSCGIVTFFRDSLRE